MNLRDHFINWYYNTFSQEDIFLRMNATVEHTFWHREDNVGIHTNMVVAQYLCFAPEEWTLSDLCGGFAVAFHDVGKPSSKVMKISEERGEYPSFAGHEQVSARMWEDYATTRLSELKISVENIFHVGWLIEHHLPYSIKKTDKRLSLEITAYQLGVNTFMNVLLADAFGRLSDNIQSNRQQVVDWTAKFSKDAYHAGKTFTIPNSSLQLIVPIGCSGSGKSTLRKTVFSDYEKFSLDDLRHQFYDAENYENAYNMSVEDKTFSNRANGEFYSVIKRNKNVFVDNTNLSRKRRRFYIDEARKRGYTTVAVVMPVPLQLTLDRQTTRTDKCVPNNAVIRQYMSVQYPSYGEFDQIIVFKSF